MAFVSDRRRSVSVDSLDASPAEIDVNDDVSISDLSDNEGNDHVGPVSDVSSQHSRSKPEDQEHGDHEVENQHHDSAFLQLPSAIIERILYVVDPNSFASLALLNRRWRAEAQIPHLYAHHLSLCPSYSLLNNVIVGPYTLDDLPQLRRQFALEARRNLFNAYFRPRVTTVKLISTSTSSSAAFPRGEAFRFNFSPRGRILLALSSARIFVIDVTVDPIQVKRELKPQRRPLAAAILDDASLLAVLSSKHDANLYRLNDAGVQHLKMLSFDHPPRTITMSPSGTVLAAAYDGGVEVYSLAEYALSTDRRAVRCDPVDMLSFSDDSTILLGTAMNLQNPNFVVISAPYYSEGAPDIDPSEVQSRMWTTQMLFPNSSRHATCAILLPDHHEADATWVFAYDQTLGCFRISQPENIQNGFIYFLGPNAFSRISRDLPSGVPSANPTGSLVATLFSTDKVWIHGIPQNVDSRPDWSHVAWGGPTVSKLAMSPNFRPQTWKELARDYSTMEDASEGLPRTWQEIVYGDRHFIVEGRQILEMPGISAVQWTTRKDAGPDNERLVAVAPGGVNGVGDDVGEEAPVDSGRIVLLDFEESIKDGEKSLITIEVGEITPEPLPEETQNIESEVAIVRRRTQRQTPGGLGASRRGGMSRARAAVPTAGAPLVPPLNVRENRRTSTTSPSSPAGGPTMEEMQEALDMPYSHTQPRSRTTLHRAATAVAENRRWHPRAMENGHVVYRRPNGRGELPHESDADNWVPPPPPYTADPDEPLPEHLRLTLLPRQTEPIQRVTQPPPQPVRASTRYDDLAYAAVETAVHRTRTTIGRVGSLARGDRPRDPFRFDSESHLLRDPSRYVDPHRLTNRVRRSSSGDSVGLRSAFEQGTHITRRPISTQPRWDPISPVTEASSMQPQSSGTPSQATLASSQPPLGPNLVAPVSLIPELTLPIGSVPQIPTDTGVASSRPAASALRTDGRRLTLSGTNLQNRLSYPVPPAPDEEPAPIGETTPSRVNSSDRFAPAPAPAPTRLSSTDPYALPRPTPLQIGNLQRRHSQSNPNGPRPPSVASNHRRSGSSGSNMSGPHSPSRIPPPRAALGAMPVSSPSLQTPQLSPARSIARSNSRGSDHSFSASTPNLQRPHYRRLDTIQSIASSHQVPFQSRTLSQDLGERRGRVGGDTTLPLSIQDDRPIVTDRGNSRYSGRRGRKWEAAGGRVDAGGRMPGSGVATVEGDHKAKRKGPRCVVM